MNRVLMIAYFFPPLGGGGCQRTLKLARYLEPNGWASTVVTVKDPDYWIVDPTLLNEVPMTCEVLRAGGLTSQRLLRLLGGAGVERTQGDRNAGAFRALRRLQQMIAIPDGYRAWARAAGRVAGARLSRGSIDALWTTSSPESAHLAGLALKQRFGIPWVADFRDPWVGRATYAPPTAWHDRRHRGLEESVITAADRVTVVSEAMAARFRERYPAAAPEKFVVLPNGFDPDDWARAARLSSSDETKDDAAARRFVLLHAGQLAHRPTVATLLEAARRLLEEKPARRDTVRLRFMGGNEGLDDVALARAGLAHAPGIVEVVPSRPHLQALVAMKRADMLVLLGHGGAGDAQIYTGKIYEYLTSGRPILGILDPGPAADLLRASGTTSVCRPGDVDAVLNAIRHPLDAFEGGKTTPDVPLPAMAATWTRQAMAKDAAELLNSIVRAR